ncbi:unnamed protein product [Urochloa decumbens]|uniref:Centromere protein X n=1 Tax=Urochloa decumbens TaxID=240449 RepID=A0ABC8YV08_9POAL
MVFLLKMVGLDFCFCIGTGKSSTAVFDYSFHHFGSAGQYTVESNFDATLSCIVHDMLTCCVHLTANAGALKVSCELLRIFVTEAIRRSAFNAEAEDAVVIEPTHLERVLPQLLLDF